MNPNLQHSGQEDKQYGNYSQDENNTVQSSHTFISDTQLSIEQFFKQLWQRIQKLLVSANYFLHNITFGMFENMRFPWLKIGIVGVLAFVLMQKDLHFQIHMRAPLGGGEQAQNEQAQAGTEQLSLTPSLNFLDAAKAALLVSNLDESKTEKYIKRFGKVAIAEQQKYKVPASVKMAIAILESEAGTSNYTKQTNNHFGQAMNGQYQTAWENWRAHSQMIVADDSPYKGLLRYGNDYKSWAKGLKDLGYSTVKNYDELLVDVIEKYEMYRMDDMDVRM